MNLSISSGDLFNENEILNLPNQAKDKSINEISLNLSFGFKKLGIRIANKI